MEETCLYLVHGKYHSLVIRGIVAGWGECPSLVVILGFHMTSFISLGAILNWDTIIRSY